MSRVQVPSLTPLISAGQLTPAAIGSATRHEPPAGRPGRHVRVGVNESAHGGQQCPRSVISSRKRLLRSPYDPAARPMATGGEETRMEANVCTHRYRITIRGGLGRI